MSFRNVIVEHPSDPSLDPVPVLIVYAVLTTLDSIVDILSQSSKGLFYILTSLG